jgi:hypothetical protein
MQARELACVHFEDSLRDMRQRKFLEFDLEAMCRATAKDIENAGWELGSPDLRKEAGMPGGPTIYLCHYEAQYLVMVGLIAGGIERIQSDLGAQGITFQDACDTLGTIMDEIATEKRSFDRETRNLLTCAAGFYIGGTKSYEIGKAQLVDQYVVIRHHDASGGERILRPAATHQPGPLTPRQISDFVVAVLKIDRGNHPERFRKGQPFRFRPKPL